MNDIIILNKDEEVIVSFYYDEKNWYLFTTQYIIGKYNNLSKKININEVKEINFDIFKDFKNETGIMKIMKTNSDIIKLKYETGKASMAPIYYRRYWQIKHDILMKVGKRYY